jgi:hypothetical protein
MCTFLTKKYRCNNVIYWENTIDSKKNFIKNRKKLGNTWYYYDKDESKLSYNYNELGYREIPLKNISWKESIVLFGDSIVEGIGNTLEDTIGKNLEKILNIPVINLGVSGSAVDFSCINSLRLHEFYGTPKAVVHLWTGLNRYSDFISNETFASCQPKNSSYFFKLNWKNRSINYVVADRALWKKKTVYYEATFFDDTSKSLNIQKIETIGLARDMDHPCYKSNKLAAQIIAKNLIEQGIGN